jgi:hypothetical protein
VADSPSTIRAVPPPSALATARAEIVRLQAKRCGPSEIAQRLNAAGIAPPPGRNRWRKETVELVAALADEPVPAPESPPRLDPRRVVLVELARYGILAGLNAHASPPCVIADEPVPGPEGDEVPVRIIARAGDLTWLRDTTARVMAAVIRGFTAPAVDGEDRPTMTVCIPLHRIEA